jgi:anti-anti-sigma regulatory factor
VTLEQHATDWLLRLEGQVNLASAGELKTLLLQWSAGGQHAGTNLEMDLERVEEIDITILQLLSAAVREAGRNGVRVTARASSEVIAAVRDAGFDRIPGFPIQA